MKRTTHMLATLTTTTARDEDLSAAIARVTGLSELTVRRRLDRAHGKMLVRNLFEADWPVDDDNAETLGEMTAALARDEDHAGEIAKITGLGEATVRRRLNA